MEVSFFTVVNKSNVNNEMCQLLIFVCGPVVFASPGYNRPGRVNVKHQVTHGFGKGSFLVQHACRHSLERNHAFVDSWSCGNCAAYCRSVFLLEFPSALEKAPFALKILVKGTKPPWPIRVCGKCVCGRVLSVFEFCQYSSFFSNDGNISVTRCVCY